MFEVYIGAASENKDSLVAEMIMETVQNTDEITPRSSGESVDDENLPLTYASTLPTELPPSPPGECDLQLEVGC